MYENLNITVLIFYCNSFCIYQNYFVYSSELSLTFDNWTKFGRIALKHVE